MSDTGLIDLSPAEAKAMLDQGSAILIDVREPYEYGFERIPGALLYPLATFDPAALPCGNGQKIILQCGTSKRSGLAGQKMLGAGCAVVYHVKGGIAAWKEAGLPLLGINPTTGAIERKTA